jgi:hypothetical protein
MNPVDFQTIPKESCAFHPEYTKSSDHGRTVGTDQSIKTMMDSQQLTISLKACKI